MDIKAIFHGAEDKWYDLLDKIDAYVPVYKIVDPIDKMVPSFAVALGLIGLLIVVFGILPLFGGTSVVAAFTDGNGEPISGLVVRAEWGDTSNDSVTNSLGKIVLNGVPMGSELTLTINEPDWAPFTQTQTISEGNARLAFTLAPRTLPPAQLAFQFVDGGGLSLDGKELQVSLVCSNGAVLPQSIYTVKNGVLTLTPPQGCGTLVGSVSGNGITRQDGILFSADNPIIRLNGLSSEKGKVKITVRSEGSDAILPGMDVQLIDAYGIPGQSLVTNDFGVAIFNDTPVGAYTASVRDSMGDYAVTASNTFQVAPNQTVSVDVSMGKQVQGTLRVSVTDKATNAWVANATVKVVRKVDNQLVTSALTTSENNPVTLNISEKGPFIVYAVHANYLSGSQDIGLLNGDQTISLALEKLTAQNSGKITVNVKDEDALPVDNAQIILYDAASGFIAQAYNSSVTDSNGNAKFQGVQSGTYFARATKYPAGPSDSSNFTTDKSVPAETSLVLKLGQASVQVNVKDLDGNPVPFATVEFRTDGTDECTPGKCAVQTDAQGSTSRTFKADRKIFVRASASGFSTFTSLAYQLYPAQPVVIPVKLSKTILGNAPKIALARVEDPVTGLHTGEIKSGKTYRAVFQVQVPSALNNLDGGGMHIHVGEETFLENDALQITGIAAPASVIVKGTSYQPSLGYSADQEHLTNGNAKWANVQWSMLEPGVYEIGVLIRVSEQATPLESLPIYYRMWGLRDGQWLRDPVDAALGTGASSPSKDGQYAETYQQIYYNGKPIVCGETFCYSGEGLLNVDDSLLVDGPPFGLNVNKIYRYSFVLTSNSPAIYAHPKLRVFASANGITPSSEVLYSAYTLTGAQGQPLQGSGLSTNDIPGGEGQGLDVGPLEQYKTIVGNFDFLTKQTNPTNIVVQLISDGDIVFQQVAPVSIASSQSLTIEVDPSTASAFLPTTFSVHVTDGSFDIQDARVSLLKIDPNQNQQFVNYQHTDISGKATLIAPPSLPNTHFVIDAVKGGYASTPVTIVVDANVAKFDPTMLAFSLPNSPNTDQFLPLDITNITQSTMLLTHASITGDFQGFLANGEMQNWVAQYAGITTIPKLETKTIQIKASTAPTVNLVSGKTLKGKAILTFRAENSAQEWVQAVPFTVQIKIVSSCDDEAIQISGTPGSGTIETSAFSNATQIPFQVANICEVEGQPYQLKNLKAKVVWHSSPIGNVELAVTDVGGSNNTTEVLKNGSYVPLYDTFKTVDDSIYESVLSFTPLPGHVGETADFTVTIAAEAGAGSSTQTITKTFDMKVLITNLESCIKFEPEPEAGIVIKAAEDEAEFQIDTSACGNVPVDIQFCNGANNSNCSGGAPEGRLYLSQFAINNLKGSKTITVERKSGTLPGSYDLTVDARVPGTSLRRVASLNVKVESDSSYAFDMEKSDLTLYQQNAKDSTSVVNKLLLESVQVKASVCDWEDVAGRPVAQTLGIAGLAGVATYYAASTAVTGGIFSSAIFNSAAINPTTLAIAVVVLVILSLFDDKCDDTQTHPLTDYVINLSGAIDQHTLPPDALNIQLSSNVAPHVAAEWNVQGSNIFKKGDKTQQVVGAVFTNTTGYSDPNPLFGVVGLRATEHVHGDPSHSGAASTTCNNGSFGPFLVGPSPAQGSCSPAYDTVRVENFHVKFRTQDENQSLPNLTFDSVACVSGTTLGATGAGTLPKVALNWSWNDATGINPYTCDASNPSGIYCDATQFNIDLMKRIKALDGFLAANNYTFECPENPNAQPSTATFPNGNPIPAGFIGFTSLGYAFQNAEVIQFTGTIANQTNTSQSGTFTVNLAPVDTGNDSDSGFPFSPETITCTANATIPAGGSQSVPCTINGLSAVTYTGNFVLASSTTSNISYSSTAMVLNVGSYSNASTGTCNDLAKTTALLLGRPGINVWIDRDDPQTGQYVQDTTITFTPEVPNVETLNKLLHFDARLIRDGYSHDFENDFRDYYSTSAFADAPSWFKGANGVAGFNAFYGDNDNLVFSNTYFDDPTLPAAGKYRVDVSAFFGDDWRLLGGDGQPKATIGVDFYHLENPVPNSPFYKLPFDGQVGLQNTTYERVGYGLEYINENTPIKVNDSLVQTQSGTGSTALAQVNVSMSTDLRTLNTIPSSRGNILEVSAASGSASQSIQFTPSLATPVMMKITHAVSTQPFSVFYTISNNGSPVDTGSTLTFWEGAGLCYDYTGVPIFERFNFTPDRAAAPQDQLNAWQYAYAQDWTHALTGGDAYIRTILYTPTNTGSYSLQVEGGGAKLFTSNYAQPSTSQALDGISTLPYDNASQVIDSVQDVFDLVASGKICVSDSGAKARFYWNPQTLYQQTSQTSLTAAGNALVAGQTCLAKPV